MNELGKLALVAAALCAGPFLSRAGEESAAINSGMSGSWYDPAIPGQGVLIDVISSRGELFGAWFTFGPDGARWLTLQGDYTGASADLTVYETTGGEFHQPTPVTTTPVGQATLEFFGCAGALLSFDFDAKGSGQIDLSRLTPDVHCQELAGQPSTPLFFRLNGEALTFDEDGNSAECAMELIYEIAIGESEPGRVAYHGVHGGFISRTTLDPAGAGFQFNADVFDPDTQVIWSDPSKVTLDGPGTEDDEHPFWRGLTTFGGLLDAAGRGVGGWNCAGFAFDPGTGFNDNGIVAKGTWMIRPISDENQMSKVADPEARGLTVSPIVAHQNSGNRRDASGTELWTN